MPSKVWCVIFGQCGSSPTYAPRRPGRNAMSANVAPRVVEECGRRGEARVTGPRPPPAPPPPAAPSSIQRNSGRKKEEEVVRGGEGAVGRCSGRWQAGEKASRQGEIEEAIETPGAASCLPCGCAGVLGARTAAVRNAVVAAVGSASRCLGRMGSSVGQ